MIARDLSGARALTLWEPWATLVASGIKQFETRSWGTSFRGPLIVTAAKCTTKSRAAFHAAMTDEVSGLFAGAERWPVQGPALVGLVDVVGCSEIGRSAPDVSELERRLGVWTPGRFAWRLANPVRLPGQFSVTGRQGLWTPGPELVQDVARQLRALAAPHTCPVCDEPQDFFRRGALDRFCFGCDRWLCEEHAVPSRDPAPVGPHSPSAHVGLDYRKVLRFGGRS